jgi:hypothetical protein
MSIRPLKWFLISKSYSTGPNRPVAFSEGIGPADAARNYLEQSGEGPQGNLVVTQWFDSRGIALDRDQDIPNYPSTRL